MYKQTHVGKKILAKNIKFIKYKNVYVVMADVIKLRKGLDINLTGKASKEVTLQVKKAEEYALVPDAFVGVTPKVVVKEGDHVNSGDALFVNKVCPEVLFASPECVFCGKMYHSIII